MRSHPVIGMLSGCGGAGASTCAAVLAAVATRNGGPGFLLDCDPLGGGIDVLLGSERSPGPRWGQVRMRGGPLDPAVLRDGLPTWHGVSFLAADTAQPPDEAVLLAIVDAAVQAGVVVLDLPRHPSPLRSAALDSCDLVVLVTPAEVRAVTAAALLVAGLQTQRAAIVVRGSSRILPANHIGELLGLEVLASFPFDGAAGHPSGLDPARLRRGTRTAAASVLAAAQQRSSRPMPPAGVAAA